MKRKKYTDGTNAGGVAKFGLNDAMSLAGPAMGLISQIGSLVETIGTDLYNPQPVVTQRQTASFNPYSKDFGKTNLPKFAMGGVADQVPIEVEGGEMLETPQGSVSEAQGPTHAQGGIDVNVPQGTQIFSDRISIDGKTMAQRKKGREKSIVRLQKMLAKNPYDKTLKNTLERLTETNEFEDNRDLEIQGVIGGNNKQQSREKFSGGTGIDGIEPVDYTGMKDGLLKDLMQKYNPYTPPVDNSIPRYSVPRNKNMFNDDGVSNFISPEEQKSVADANLQNSTSTSSALNIPVLPNSNSIELPAQQGINPYAPSLPTYPITPDSKLTGKQKVSNMFNNVGNWVKKKYSKNKDNATNPTTGDYVGMAGNLFGGLAPLLNTDANRATDTPNINAFKNFGVDAIQANEDAATYVRGQRENNIRDLKTNKNSAKMGNRNNAMSVNTMRALDSVTDGNYEESLGKVYNSFAQMMQSNLAQKSQLENMQDQAVMGGEQARDLADRQDKDNYATQRGQDLANLGNNIYGAGKALNVSKENRVGLKLTTQLSKYGLTYDKEGNLVQDAASKEEEKTKLELLEANGLTIKNGKIVKK
jgi:hypothetical protein